MKSDTAHYRDWLSANAGRIDVPSDHVRQELAQIEARLRNPDFAHKRTHYRTRRGELRAVLRVLEAN